MCILQKIKTAISAGVRCSPELVAVPETILAAQRQLPTADGDG
ncbi:hypothetical protein [Tsukamurella serpentis]